MSKIFWLLHKRRKSLKISILYLQIQFNRMRILLFALIMLVSFISAKAQNTGSISGIIVNKIDQKVVSRKKEYINPNVI